MDCDQIRINTYTCTSLVSNGFIHVLVGYAHDMRLNTHTQAVNVENLLLNEPEIKINLIDS